MCDELNILTIQKRTNKVKEKGTIEVSYTCFDRLEQYEQVPFADSCSNTDWEIKVLVKQLGHLVTEVSESQQEDGHPNNTPEYTSRCGYFWQTMSGCSLQKIFGHMFEGLCFHGLGNHNVSCHPIVFLWFCFGIGHFQINGLVHGFDFDNSWRIFLSHFAAVVKWDEWAAFTLSLLYSRYVHF